MHLYVHCCTVDRFVVILRKKCLSQSWMQKYILYLRKVNLLKSGYRVKISSTDFDLRDMYQDMSVSLIFGIVEMKRIQFFISS
jgi:hypothetical protein